MPVYTSIEYKGSTILIWEIQESEEFFANAIHLQSDIKHPKRRIEYLAGRYVLQQLIPNIDLSQISISHIGKPYLKDGSGHFSISHSYPYIAVAVHPSKNIGLDIQVYRAKIMDLIPKFTHTAEYSLLQDSVARATLLWNVKEALFKWRGTGGQDFSEQLRILSMSPIADNKYSIDAQVIDEAGPIHHLLAWGCIEPEFSLAICLSEN